MIIGDFILALLFVGVGMTDSIKRMERQIRLNADASFCDLDFLKLGYTEDRWEKDMNTALCIT